MTLIPRPNCVGRLAAVASGLLPLLLLASCGGSSTPSTPVVNQTPISLALSASAGVVVPDGSTVTVNATITRPAGDNANVTLTVTGAPSCIQTTTTNPQATNSGSVAFSSAQCSASGTYAVSIQASDGTTNATVTYALTVPVLVTLADAPQVNEGVNGQFNEAMSTAFQPASWDYKFFQNHPDTSALNALHPHHIRLQPVEAGVPQKADGSWDFSTLNAILEPVASVSDNSPELQLATAPAWMCNSNGTLQVAHFADFANYAAQLVQYYNTRSGFTDSTGTYAHAVYTPITYWGIFNEPNYNGLSPSEYTTLYNMVVPAMQQAASDIPIKFVGLELGDNFNSVQQSYIAAFSSGATAQVDVIATHFYSSCNQADSDSAVMATIADNFVPELQYLLATKRSSANASLSVAPVWVTENNVNADYSNNGISMCNGGTFVTDKRGTSAFFAGWRPYVYSQFGKLGIEALYHWLYDGDQQYGEVDYNTGNKYLSYWVDYYLQQYLCGQNPASCDSHLILQTTSSESAANSSVEVIATGQSADNSVNMMFANHAVASAHDNNGTGAPRTVVVHFQSPANNIISGTQLTIDANTDPSSGPTALPVTPFTNSMTLTFNGYGVTFLHLFFGNPVSGGVIRQNGRIRPAPPERHGAAASPIWVVPQEVQPGTADETSDTDEN
jgi:hypothetical protein